ncbi:MAG TPA: hypothetical protein VHE35_34510, partial [Kofleriaceae bacterium]|nr:hypothetical protein [Kofleriaceae bacterium]
MSTKPGSSMPVSPSRTSLALGALVAIGAACALTCSGGAGVDAPARLHGQVWCGGPVAGATVRVYQLVDGQQLAQLAEQVTGADGRFDVHAAGYQHLLVVADGGRFTDGGATILVPAGHGLRGIAVDVAAGEDRDVEVTPLTDVLAGLALARAASGEPFNDALALVHDRLTAHLDFDPTRTPIAD